MSFLFAKIFGRTLQARILLFDIIIDLVLLFLLFLLLDAHRVKIENINCCYYQ